MYTYTMNIENRILKLCSLRGDCFEFDHPSKNGRPYIVVGGVTKNAYRLYYESLIGPLGEDTIDHTCFNKACINVEHLEPVSRSENSRRGVAKYMADNPTFACGHPRTPEYWVVWKRGDTQVQRRCRLCTRTYNREYMRKNGYKYA